MAWSDVDPRLRTVAERVCTRAEIQVLGLLAENLSIRAIAKTLGVKRQTIQTLWRRAERKIQHEVALMRGYDNAGR